MQPAPLTGTATGRSLKETLHLVSDAARTPHGDSNSAAYLLNNLSMSMQPAPLTGTATAPPGSHLWSYRCSPRPSRGQQLCDKVSFGHSVKMQPAPLTGTATSLVKLLSFGFFLDAARTPHGDSNFDLCILVDDIDIRCSPHPSRGRKKGRQETALFLVSLFIYKRLFPHLTLPYR